MLLPPQESLFPARVVYDLLFFFIVIIIVLNLIFGVIIDTFADLRSEKQKKEEVLKTTCFICGEATLLPTGLPGSLWPLGACPGLMAQRHLARSWGELDPAGTWSPRWRRERPQGLAFKLWVSDEDLSLVHGLDPVVWVQSFSPCEVLSLSHWRPRGRSPGGPFSVLPAPWAPIGLAAGWELCV